MDAQFALGVSFANGSGGAPRDEDVAMFWYRQAAEQEDPDAQFALGCLYANRGNGGRSSSGWEKNGGKNVSGCGLSQDLAQSIHWFKRAAQRGHAQSATALSVSPPMGDFQSISVKLQTLINRFIIIFIIIILTNCFCAGTYSKAGIFPASIPGVYAAHIR